MELKENIDYYIKPVGKSFELTSMTLQGYTAGIIDLTRRSYDINQDTVKNIGMLLTALTIPKIKKVVTKSKK